MGWFILAHIFSTILSLIQVGRLSEPEPETTGEVKRRQILGGIINDYFRSSDKTAVYPA